MTTPLPIPLDLIQANLELQAKLATLMQDTGRAWLAMGEGLARQQQPGDALEAARLALGLQERFGKGVQLALGEWQQRTTGSLAKFQVGAVPDESPLALLLRPWQQALEASRGGR